MVMETEKTDEKTTAIHELSKVYEATTDDEAFYAKIFKCQPFIYMNEFYISYK